MSAPLPNPQAVDAFTWKGYRWTVRGGGGGPGNRPWKTNNVLVDGDGNLVLGITKQRGVWTACEVDLNKTLGYGEYRWDCATPLEFDKHVVFAGFLYKDDRNEIDVEYSHWSELATNGSYTIQPPPDKTGVNQDFFAVPKTLKRTRTIIHYAPKSIWLKTIDLTTGKTIRKFTYKGTTYPTTGLRFIFNLWLTDATAPSNRKPVQVVITDFHFSAIKTASRISILHALLGGNQDR